MTESTQDSQDRLYNLLPAIYRIRDANEGGQSLRALMAVIESEFKRLEQDIDGLYDDWFIETCAEWVIPYIGDLLGVRNLHSGDSSGGVFSSRAYVANTLSYRRRKGTAPVLEQLARDVTGWPAHAEEFFQRLITNQHLNHVRLQSHATVDLRNGNQLELLGGPFESATHTAEVRRIASNRGKYNIPNIGLFLWRLQSYSMLQSTPRKLSGSRYTFSPLGNDIPLFNRPQTETEITHLAEEINVPGLLRRRALYDELTALREMLTTGSGNPPERYFGQNPVIQVFFDETELQPEEILICDLSGWEETGWQPADSKTFTKSDATTFTTKVSVDPALGRLAILNGITPPDKMKVSYSYGFSGDIGGGPYKRRQTLTTSADADTWEKTVAQDDPDADFTTLADALSEWATWAAADSDHTDAIINIIDNGTYQEQLSITMNNPLNLTIQADEGSCPTLRLMNGSQDTADFVITSGDPDAGATLTLNGLWIEGGISIEKESGLQKLSIIHCTLVPGRGLTAGSKPRQPTAPSITVSSESNDDLQVEIQYSSTGPLDLPDEITSLSVQDSIVEAERASVALVTKKLPALISGSLSTYKKPSAAKPTVQVQIGDEGPYIALIKKKPLTLPEARDALQKAIRAAHKSAAFAKAQVIIANKRLVILPGVHAPITIKATPTDTTTGSELKLCDGSERLVQALLSSQLAPSFTLSSEQPKLTVNMNGKGPFIITLDSTTSTLAAARDQLYTAIRSADADKAFKDALVGNLDDRLVVLPGVPDATVTFGPADDDQTTFLDLGLGYIPLAIGAGGGQPGPKTSIERSTIFGNTYVRELTLGSETIFTGPVITQRRQVGCTRFCFLPDGSRVPRRYCCQPDLALDDYAGKAGKSSVDLLSHAQQEAVIAQVTPAFTSERYGEPEYGQLSLTCAEEIATGAEDGSEMGVFCQLKQPQRKANLGATLEEYLRFGLEAGIFDVILKRNEEQGDNNEG